VLRLMNALFTDELVAMLVAWPRLAALTVLDLSLGTLTDAGVGVLLAAHPPGLTTLVVSGSCLSPAGLARLHATRITIVDEDATPDGRSLAQKPGRYISVAE
jgi:hypothetical protein